MTTPLIFLDVETTGLDPARHEVWELAYAREDGPVRSFQLAHSLTWADEEALRINGYRERIGRESKGHDPSLMTILAGATIVGSNPAFDTAMLRARWRAAPWHHRLINVAEGAMWLFGWERPKGLADVRTALMERGYDIPEPDHTAAGDVEATRATYYALRDLVAEAAREDR